MMPTLAPSVSAARHEGAAYPVASRLPFRLRPVLFSLLAFALLPVAACQKKKAPEEIVLSAQERVAPSPVGSTQTILHKTFSVTASVKFPFEIPAHAVRPQLHGTYRSFVQQASVQSNDDAANVDFLLLNEDQYADFSRGQSGDTLFSVDSSHNQDVNFDLPATQDQPRKYYLVFRSSPGGAAKKVVDADFTVDF